MKKCQVILSYSMMAFVCLSLAHRALAQGASSSTCPPVSTISLLNGSAYTPQERRTTTQGSDVGGYGGNSAGGNVNGTRAGQTGQGKPYIISVGLREEYDSNINDTNTQKKGSFKTIVSPDFLFKYPMDQTTLTARYSLGASYYYDRPGNNPWDLTHDFSMRLEHEFSDRLNLSVSDAFNYSQSPQIGGSDTLIVKRSGDGWVNSAGGEVTYSWTPKFSTVTGYHNQVNGYDDSQLDSENRFMENGINQDFRLQVLDTTTAVLSYAYDNTDYHQGVKGYDSHTFDGGVDHYLLREWLVSARAGAQYVEYTNSMQQGGANPYVSVRTTWNFLPSSSLNASYNLGTTVTDYSSYGSQYRHNFQLGLSHSWTRRLSTSAGLSLQLSSFGQNEAVVPGAGSQNETTIQASLGATYVLTDWLSLDAGYTYTDLEADAASRAYDKHQLSFGVRGTY